MTNPRESAQLDAIAARIVDRERREALGMAHAMRIEAYVAMVAAEKAKD